MPRRCREARLLPLIPFACEELSRLLARYLQDWLFEGLLRVAVNGRLDELRFYGPHSLNCTPVSPVAAHRRRLRTAHTRRRLPM